VARARTGVRVIAGSAKGRRLDTPGGDTTRPITDRVKESVFGALEPILPGARVLDLYAGSGAMAIEALSRGAASATLVEKDPRVVEVIASNVSRVGVEPQTTIVKADVLVHLARATATEFDVVFLDPPYAAPTSDVERAMAALGAGWLAPRATVVVRRQKRSTHPVPPPGLEFTRIREYGDTVVLVAQTH